MAQITVELWNQYTTRNGKTVSIIEKTDYSEIYIGGIVRTDSKEDDGAFEWHSDGKSVTDPDMDIIKWERKVQPQNTQH